MSANGSVSSALPLSTISRVFAFVNFFRPATYWRYKMNPIPIDSHGLTDYKCGAKLGRGSFSVVFEAIRIVDGRKCAMKRMARWTRQGDIKREIQILRELDGRENTIQLLAVHRDPTDNTICLVFECFENLAVYERSNALDYEDIKYFMFQLLRALHYSHSKGIMHRDIKPENVLINSEQRTLRLIDWGLADFYHPNREYDVREGTKRYLAPEMLLKYPLLDYSIDMWAFGCTLAGMIFRRMPFFRARSRRMLLKNMASVIGGQQFHEFVKAYDIDEPLPSIPATSDRMSWDAVAELSADFPLDSPDVHDLLDRLLLVDPHKRFTAKEAMQHSYFDSVRDAAS